jgi:hypothetical protein
MSARDELLRACATGDEVTLGRHGWRPVFDALAGWWPKRFGATDLRPYVTLLADERPEAIVAALELLTTMRGGGFRPSPASCARSSTPTTTASGATWAIAAAPASHRRCSPASPRRCSTARSFATAAGRRRGRG